MGNFFFCGHQAGECPCIPGQVEANAALPGHKAGDVHTFLGRTAQKCMDIPCFVSGDFAQNPPSCLGMQRMPSFVSGE